KISSWIKYSNFGRFVQFYAAHCVMSFLKTCESEYGKETSALNLASNCLNSYPECHDMNFCPSIIAHDVSAYAKCERSEHLENRSATRFLHKPCYVVSLQGKRGSEAADSMMQGLIICRLFLPYI
ncbi:MAG: hypothetical protein ACD_19C00397G0001, partial [uncultured bacterium]